jgi:uncharacterized protein YqeY
MSMLETISEDLKAAMKGGDKLRLETIRSIRAALLEKQVEKRPQGGVTAEDEMSVLISLAKKRKESITIFRQNGRDDLANQEEKELSIIGEYLPKQLDANEVTQIIKRIVSEFGATSPKDFGKVMPAVMKELKGKADGKLIQETVKQLLGA